ncbi:MAG: hypothetical protein JWR21_4078 [Herminiimonas sp.]|nr:hypothetical protein [Herminiimonas sp.]
MEGVVHVYCGSKHVPRALKHLSHTWRMLAFSLLLAGCGGGVDKGTSPAASGPAPTEVAKQNFSGQSRLAASSAPTEAISARSAPANEPAASSPDPARLAQIRALPHLSSLSDREKAGLLMLLPSQSPPQRQSLINMYPGLVGLPVQQKQVLLDQLERIVPVGRQGDPKG